MKIGKNTNCGTAWRSVPDCVWTQADEAHLWRLALNISGARDCLYKALSPDEKDRAARFRFDRDRDHFIVSRGSLRSILGKYMDLPPDKLEFQYSPYGKPSLVRCPGSLDLRFNISHSGEVALVGIADGRELGVDVEQIRGDVDVEAIAQRFFSSAEQAALRKVPAGHKYESFYACWTRKEAYLKAMGQGLSLPLDSFDVSLAPGIPAAILATRPDPSQSSRWRLLEILIGPGYAASLAVESAIGNVQAWDCSTETGMRNLIESRGGPWQ